MALKGVCGVPPTLYALAHDLLCCFLSPFPSCRSFDLPNSEENKPDDDDDNDDDGVEEEEEEEGDAASAEAVVEVDAESAALPSAKLCMATRCCSVSCVGICTLKVTNCDPTLLGLLTSRMPFPLITRFSPGCVPASTFSVASPVSVGTDTLPPSTAILMGTGTVTCTSLPSRVKRG